MKTRIFTGTLAAAGLALALSGCSSSTSGTTGGTTTGGNAGDAVATVGTTTITRADIGKYLEPQYGSGALADLIDTALIEQALKAKNQDVSDADVDAELEKRKAENPQLASQLELEPTLLGAIKASFKRNLALMKLVTADVKEPSDDDLKKFFATYGSFYDTPAQVRLGVLISSSKPRADIMERALTSKAKTFSQLVTEQKNQKDKDPMATQSHEADAKFQSIDSFPGQLKDLIAKLPDGGNTPVQALPGPAVGGVQQNLYVIFHKEASQAAKKADLASVKTQLTNDWKMAQVAQEEVKKNPSNPPFADTLQRTRTSLGPTATLNDTLQTILQPAGNNKLIALRSAGGVQITDPTYTKVGDQYKAAPAAGATAAPGATPGAAPADASATAPAAPKAP